MRTEQKYFLLYHFERVTAKPQPLRAPCRLSCRIYMSTAVDCMHAILVYYGVAYHVMLRYLTNPNPTLTKLTDIRQHQPTKTRQCNVVAVYSSTAVANTCTMGDSLFQQHTLLTCHNDKQQYYGCTILFSFLSDEEARQYYCCCTAAYSVVLLP